ncbi:hypothetical protein ACTFIU_005205 [Dictyostelium citrinum]
MNITNSIKVKSSKSIKKDVNVLGVDLSYSLLDIEFDDEFFTYDSLACPNFTCEPIIPTIDCSCDYTDIGECPKVKGRDKSCPPCPETFSEQITEGPNGFLGGAFCNRTVWINGTKFEPLSKNWTVIELNKDYTYTTNKVMQFRIKADTQSCMGMMLKVSPIQNYPISAFGSVPSFEMARFVSGSKLETNAIYNICPTDNWNKTQHYTYTRSWTRDTYFIMIDPQSVTTTFTLILRSKKVEPLLLSSSSSSSSNDNNNTTTQKTCTSIYPLTHRCINLGENIFGVTTYENQRDYYTLSIDQPSIYFFQFPSLFLTTSIFISDSLLNLYPNESTSQWFKKDSYENYFTLYLEPKSDKDLIIYIGVFSYLPTNYSFCVTRNGFMFPNLLSAMSIQQGAFSLASTSIFLPIGKNMNDSDYFYTCNSQAECNPFSILYPTIDINPLWPVPPVLYGVEDFDFKSVLYTSEGYHGFGIINSKFKARSYQVAILLKYDNGKGDRKEYITYEEVLASSIQFLSTLTDSKGKLIDFKVTGFQDVTSITCNHTEFKRVLDLVDYQSGLILNSLVSPSLNELNNWRYELGVLMLNDAWIGCSSKVLDMLDIRLITKNISSYFCPWQVGDTEFATDPCCNSTYQYYRCCNPRYVETQVYEFHGIISDVAKNQCNSDSLDCSLSVLEEYGNYLTNDDQLCGDPSTQSTEIQYSLFYSLRNCKDITLIPPYCKSDSECTLFSPNAKCDLFTRKCFLDYDLLDRMYVDCVFQELSPATLFSFVSSTTYNSTIIDNKYKQHFTDDCVSAKGSSFPIRTTYTYTTNDPYVGIIPATNCLDKSCKTIYNSLFDIYYSGWTFTREWRVNENTCSEFVTCPQINCQSTLNQNTNCKDLCNQQKSLDFCGHCSSIEDSSNSTTTNSTCFNFLELNNSISCENSEPICILSNGDYLYNLTKEECELSSSIGSCTHSCGFECIGVSKLCIFADFNKTICESNGYLWNDVDGYCVDQLSTTNEQCTNNTSSVGARPLWVDCPTTSTDECSDGFFCYLQELPCKTKEQCESIGGECSDIFFFKPENVQYYPFGFGKCVTNHTFLQRDNSKTLSCPNGQIDSPNGCFYQSPVYKTKAQCLATPGNRWWSPSNNRSQCLSNENQGCRIMDVDSFANLPFNFKFNEMDQHQCEGCRQLLPTSSKWTDKFKWTNATWLPGIYIEPKWYKNLTATPRVIKSTFNYQSFYLDLVDAVGRQTADFYRSQTFCKKEKNQNSLNSLVCSCSGDGITTTGNITSCFNSSTPLLGLTNQCNGESSILGFTNGYVNLTDNSVLPGCQIITISLVSKSIFTSTVPESLASSFVSYNKPDNYGVINSNGAIIGTLLMDGIMIKSEQNIELMVVCFDITNIAYSDKYPSFDFATNYNSTSAMGSLYPMTIETYLVQDSDSTYMCSNLSNVESETVIFMINIMGGDWMDQSKELFDSTTKSLLYFLAVLFLLVGCFGCYQIILIIFIGYRSKNGGSGENQIQITHILTGLVTLFIMLRSIYFFVMPGGYLSSKPVADYILVVLPTFIYFSAFIVMIVIWYIIVFMVLKNYSMAGSRTKRLYTIVFGVNVVLYILFIIVVLVFQYTHFTPNNYCGARVVVQMKNSKPQIIVSILYAAIQAFLSLVLGSSFAYLGSSLYLTLKKANFSSLNSRSSQKSIRIFILTVVCSIGFLLHCAFILALVISKISSMAFTFVGLLLTEILPAGSILYCFQTRNNQNNETTLNSGKTFPLSSLGSIKSKKLSTKTKSPPMQTINQNYSVPPSPTIESNNNNINNNDNNQQNSLSMGVNHEGNIINSSNEINNI